MLQSFIPFLDKERYLIVYFFESFSQKEGEKNTVSLSELQNKLAVSSYKLQEIISVAQNLCHQVSDIKLDKTQDKKITIIGLNTLTLKKIILYEAQHSLRFKIFIHITLRPKGYSDIEFQRQHGISRATYFRLKNNLLNDLDTDVKKNMKESEAYSRYYIYSVVYYFSYLDFLDDNLEKKKINASINYVTVMLKLRPTNIQYWQHRYFVAVCYWRSRLGYKMSNDDAKYFVAVNTTTDLKKISSYFDKNWSTSEGSADRITNFILTFLISIEELDTDMLRNLTDYPLVVNLTHQQISLIHQSLDESCSQISLLSLTNKLLKINAKMLVPKYLETSYSKIQDWNFYEASYLSITQLTKKLLQCRTSFEHVRPVEKNEYTQLYYAYLFIIFSELPTNAFPDQVRIAVGFSQGIAYNDYIKKRLEELALLNIQVDKFLSSKTDIYLTNNFDPSFKNHQIIWEHAPLNKEMSNLRELIVKIKNEKYKKASHNVSNSDPEN